MMSRGYLKHVLISLLMIFYITPSLAQTSAQAKALRTKLFTTDGYDKKVRPSLNQSTPIEVEVNFYLLAINELNEVSETLQTTGYLEIAWKDEHLVWNMNDYGGIETSFWPQDDVWKPDVALKNSYKEYKELGASTLNVQVDYQGNVIWSPFQVFVSTCSIDVQFFPFDTQICHLRFVAWSYTNNEVLMAEGKKGIELSQYSTNSAWEVTNTDAMVEIDSGEPSIKFTLQIKRKPIFIILNTLLPVMMLAVLNMLVFVLPCESGEKAGYAITVFLSFAVFMTIVSSTLPENSDTTSWFSVYVVLLTVQSTLITSIALFMVRCSSFTQDTKVPKLLVFLTRLTRCEICKRSKIVAISPKPDNNSDEVKKVDLKSFEKSTFDNKDTETTVTWRDAMNALDLVLLVCFIVGFSLVTIVYIANTI